MAEDEAGAWFDDAADQRQAAALLHAADSRHALRAALHLRKSGKAGDLVAAAPILAGRMFGAWRALARHERADVREAAADGAARFGDQRHVASLVTLCADPDLRVRKSAITALISLRPGARAAGYDPVRPSPASLELLRKLVE